MQKSQAKIILPSYSIKSIQLNVSFHPIWFHVQFKCNSIQFFPFNWLSQIQCNPFNSILFLNILMQFNIQHNLIKQWFPFNINHSIYPMLDLARPWRRGFVSSSPHPSLCSLYYPLLGHAEQTSRPFILRSKTELYKQMNHDSVWKDTSLCSRMIICFQFHWKQSKIANQDNLANSI